ncbi:uncharacterized protein LOC127374500 [Dicentrarchus labrax]|uniref:uncharacterized protein LOC127374500 n=1 Tax=Dicentrarchus labrax TaxID=13489 RepID=UPI0021F5C77B|nr:uncharacterized protein LOC127374500 [Dicentrarchus labrax]
MATADQLLELMFSWIEQRERCAEKLRKLAKELELLREKCNAAECVGSTYAVVGSLSLIGAGVATVFTGGAAAPLLGVAGAVCSGVGLTVSVASKIIEHFSSSDTMKEAQEIEKKSNKVAEEIQDLFRQLKAECSSTDPDEVDQHVMTEILKGMARRCGLKWHLMDFKRIFVAIKRNINEILFSPVVKVALVVKLASILNFFTFKVNGKIYKHLFNKGAKEFTIPMTKIAEEGAKKLTKDMAKTGFKKAFKGGAMVVGGAVGLAFELPEAIDNWKELIKNNHVTEASQSLRDTAKAIEKICQTLREQFDNMKKMLQEMDKRQQEEEEKAKRRQEEEKKAKRRREEEEKAKRRQEEVDQTNQNKETESGQQGGGDQGDKESDRDDEESDQEDEESDCEDEESDQEDEESDCEDEESDQEDEESDCEDEESDQEDEESDCEDEESDQEDEESDCEDEESDQETDSEEETEEDERKQTGRKRTKRHRKKGTRSKQRGDSEDSCIDQDQRTIQTPPGTIRGALLNVCSLEKKRDPEKKKKDLKAHTKKQPGPLSHNRDVVTRRQCRLSPQGGFTTELHYRLSVLHHDEWNQPVPVINVYHPPGYNRDQFRTFLDEFETLLAHFNNYNSIIVTGDFNIWVDQERRSFTDEFYHIWPIYNLEQHVREPTHRAGHTLDLVLTRNVEISDLVVRDDGISDHYTVYFNAKPVSKESQEKTKENKDQDEQPKRLKKSEE